VAISNAALSGQGVDEALILLRGGAGDRNAVQETLSSLSTEYDEIYFRLGEDPSQREAALLAFRKARAASALAFALSPKSEQLHDAIYEAIAASSDKRDMLHSVEVALRD
jgi:hypothetical protein